jgi:hypothetical protein
VANYDNDNDNAILRDVCDVINNCVILTVFSCLSFMDYDRKQVYRMKLR